MFYKSFISILFMRNFYLDLSIFEQHKKDKKKTITENNMSNEDFFAHKIRTLFARFDVDSNGKIEKEDFACWSQKLISICLLFLFLIKYKIIAKSK